MKKIVFITVLLFIVFVLGKDLNPFSSRMFTFHDETQPARIQQFTKNLTKLNIPPRVAPDFLFGKGYPVFNFYAPFSYWITSAINLIGFDVVSSLKLSFLISLIVGFIGCYLFLKNFFDFYPSLLGGIFYITSLYFPLDIFIRGNLAEIWFLALFPVALHFIYLNSLKSDQKIFLTTSLILSFTLTSHNVFSLFSVPLIVFFILFLKNIKRNFAVLILAFLISSYFWLPALAEMKYTWAQEIATRTDFHDHFLCPIQLWQSPWGFGGSNKGCLTDGMAFKIGRLPLIFFFLGGYMLFHQFISKRKIHKISYFFAIITPFLLFLTLYSSQPIWDLFSSFLSIVQFPWRFIGLSLIGIAFFTAFFFHYFSFPRKNLLITVLIIIAIIINAKYFQGQNIEKKDFADRFLSTNFIRNQVAYQIPEYLPKTNDYQYWRSLEKKSNQINRIKLEPFSLKQTFIEKTANTISLLTLFFLILIFFYQPLWNSFRKQLN